MQQKTFFVYILASKKNGTLYVGITNNLARRIYEHRNQLIDSFTKRYGISRLVHYESFENAAQAIQREKNIKKWPRKWKINLIQETNPQWHDLYEELNN